MMKKWQVIKSEYIYQTPFGNLRSNKVVLPNGHENIRRKPTALAVEGRRGLYFQYILNFSFSISTLDLER